jgi:plastocyanin
MNTLRYAGVFVCTSLVVSCSTSAPSAPTPLTTSAPAASSASTASGATNGTAAATPSSATVQFGLVDVGTGIPAPVGHDRSFHANDTLVPGTVVIDAGGTVTFNIVNPHQVAIYGDGKRPEDVDTTNLVAMPAGCPNPAGAARIADDENLVAEYLQPCNAPRTPIQHQFNEPGRYLVICSFNPHFQAGMYGWVIVRPVK